MSAHRIEAVFFDMDGTVLDSHRPWSLVFNEMLVVYRGTPLTEEEDKQQLAWSMEECHMYLFPDMPMPIFLEQVGQLFGKYAATASMLPGALEAISEASKLTGGRVALVTNAPSTVVRHLVENVVALKDAFGIHFHCAYDSFPSPIPTSIKDDPELIALISDGSNKVPSKPSPLMLRIAAAQLGASADRCIMIGDGINDIHAGNRCGAITIAINWGKGTKMEEATHNVDDVKGVTEILKKYRERGL